MWIAIGIAEASTLGWSAGITQVAQELRSVGFACIVISLIIMGAEIAFRRRMETMGDGLSAVSIGALLISTAFTAGTLLFGGAAASPTLAVLGPSTAMENLASLTTWLALQAPAMGVGLWLVRRLRHG
jgi:hypothetical protein